MNSEVDSPVHHAPWLLTAFVAILTFVVLFLALDAQAARDERSELGRRVQQLEWDLTELRDGAW